MNVPERTFASRVFADLGVAICAGLAVVAWMGRSYYVLPAAQRPLAESHQFLRSSGVLGLPFGVAGFVLIILNLGYLIRRAHLRWEWAGTLRSWMSFHVFTGMVGTLLIVLHSAFLPRSPMGTLSALSLLVVAFTGLVGRYIYAHVPRSVQGQELELLELKALIEAERQELSAKGVGAESLADAPAAAAHRGMAALLTMLAESDREASREYERFRRTVEASPALAAAAQELLPLAKRFVKEKQWLARYEELRDFMGTWRFFHRWFAIVMLSVAVCHVLVATGLGGLTVGMP